MIEHIEIERYRLDIKVRGTRKEVEIVKARLVEITVSEAVVSCYMKQL